MKEDNILKRNYFEDFLRNFIYNFHDFETSLDETLFYIVYHDNCYVEIHINDDDEEECILSFNIEEHNGGYRIHASVNCFLKPVLEFIKEIIETSEGCSTGTQTLTIHDFEYEVEGVVYELFTLDESNSKIIKFEDFVKLAIKARWQTLKFEDDFIETRVVADRSIIFSSGVEKTILFSIKHFDEGIGFICIAFKPFTEEFITNKAIEFANALVELSKGKITKDIIKIHDKSLKEIENDKSIN